MTFRSISYPSCLKKVHEPALCKRLCMVDGTMHCIGPAHKAHASMSRGAIHDVDEGHRREFFLICGPTRAYMYWRRAHRSGCPDRWISSPPKSYLQPLFDRCIDIDLSRLDSSKGDEKRFFEDLYAVFVERIPDVRALLMSYFLRKSKQLLLRNKIFNTC